MEKDQRRHKHLNFQQAYLLLSEYQSLLNSFLYKLHIGMGITCSQRGNSRHDGNSDLNLQLRTRKKKVIHNIVSSSNVTINSGDTRLIFQQLCHCQGFDSTGDVQQREHPSTSSQDHAIFPNDWLRTIHEDLSRQMEAHRSTSSTTNDYISQLVTGRATLSLNINFNDGNSSVVATSTPVPSAHQHVSTSSSPSTPNTNHQVPPLYRMNRAIKSLDDLWREWYVGLTGGYAVDDLEKRWGIAVEEGQQGKKVLQSKTPDYRPDQQVLCGKECINKNSPGACRGTTRPPWIFITLLR
ncbi:uncharacterized protein BX664DRAFT_385083 [Halteromyces radiatus]|uniref:uncharacterized protein n=1 Tax=Halteromyces radiatus TaxID=101107 RepID=UPI0022201AB4|nr:uncharacterized protein BX664DRAFT_385083 [Halteromyces radiatus]KAI8093701.1 hypothetical protein BX664DRAFT_385083 [Halteromyces radiatus]